MLAWKRSRRRSCGQMRTGQWQPVVKKLQERLPQLVVHGAYDAAKRTGPAVWLKCIVAGTIKLPSPPTALPSDGRGEPQRDVVPIVYLPNISRQTLRAAADCPPLLQPLVELQYRGVVWTQRNGKDWTVEAFLMSDDGLGLKVSRDEATRNSLHSSLAVLAETPVVQLEDKQLEAEDFDKLMVGDQPRDLLEWMNDPKGAREGGAKASGTPFGRACKKDYGFDPDADGAVGAAEKLGLRKEVAWQQLWERFAEAPVLYKALPDLLTRAKPTELLFNPESWPDENDKAEARLRAALLGLGSADGPVARERLRELEKEHAKRRAWVWAKMERSVMAMGLEHLAALAERTSKTLNGANLEDVAKSYEEGGYEADLTLLRGLAEGKSNQDRAAIQAAARALYVPWLRSAAELFQKLAAKTPLGGASQQPLIEANVGECLLFADGLRYDLGQALRALCEERGMRVTLGRRWAGTPTVTATAKPAVSPVAGLLEGGTTLPDNFTPSIKRQVGAATMGGQELNTARFRKLLEDAGYQYLNAGETGDATGKGWTECGAIDRRGHDMQLGLAGQVVEELDGMLERITELLDAGWRTVRVITDHGWLLVPGGLPKTDLPGYLVESSLGALRGDSRGVQGRGAESRLVLERLGRGGDCAGHHGVRGRHGLRARRD